MGRERLLGAHRELLERWRDVQNLIGPGPSEVHYEDARKGLEKLTVPTGRWADLGTGAGFPGIVFAAMFPDVQVDLVESRSKRCAFLDAVLTQAACDEGVRVREGRLETLPHKDYDGITARALASPEDVLTWAADLVKLGGRAVIFLQADQDVPAVSGWASPTFHAYTVAGRARRTGEWVRVAS